jgi:hypothetical protein
VVGHKSWRIKIERREMASYFTPAFYRTLGIWSNIREHGFPHKEGWAELPAPLLKIVNTLNGTLRDWEDKKHGS